MKFRWPRWNSGKVGSSFSFQALPFSGVAVPNHILVVPNLSGAEALYPLLHFQFSLRLVRPWDKLSWRTRAKAFDGCDFLRRNAPKLSSNKIQGEVPYKHQGKQTAVGPESTSERKMSKIEPKHQFLGFHVSFLLGVYFEVYPACFEFW